MGWETTHRYCEWFQQYSTGVSDSAVKTEVLTPTLLLNKIKEMQHFLTLPDLDHALKVIYDHIQKKAILIEHH